MGKENNPRRVAENEAFAKTKMLRTSPQKLNLVAAMIRGKKVDKALADGEEMLVILAHGGTQMAALERYGVPRRSYYRWCGPNAGGYVLDARDWASRHELRLVKTVQYTKESTC